MQSYFVHKLCYNNLSNLYLLSVKDKQSLHQIINIFCVLKHTRLHFGIN